MLNQKPVHLTLQFPSNNTKMISEILTKILEQPGITVGVEQQQLLIGFDSLNQLTSMRNNDHIAAIQHDAHVVICHVFGSSICVDRITLMDNGRLQDIALLAPVTGTMLRILAEEQLYLMTSLPEDRSRSHTPRRSRENMPGFMDLSGREPEHGSYSHHRNYPRGRTGTNANRIQISILSTGAKLVIDGREMSVDENFIEGTSEVFIYEGLEVLNLTKSVVDKAKVVCERDSYEVGYSEGKLVIVTALNKEQGGSPENTPEFKHPLNLSFVSHNGECHFITSNGVAIKGELQPNNVDLRFNVDTPELILRDIKAFKGQVKRAAEEYWATPRTVEVHHTGEMFLVKPILAKKDPELADPKPQRINKFSPGVQLFINNADKTPSPKTETGTGKDVINFIIKDNTLFAKRQNDDTEYEVKVSVKDKVFTLAMDAKLGDMNKYSMKTMANMLGLSLNFSMPEKVDVVTEGALVPNVLHVLLGKGNTNKGARKTLQSLVK